MNYLITYMVPDVITSITTFQIIKSNSGGKTAALKYFLDNRKEKVKIVAITELDDEAVEVLRNYYGEKS